MFTTLLESRAVHPRRTSSTLASAMVHGALIAAAVMLTVHGSVDATTTAVVDSIVFVPIAPPSVQQHDAVSAHDPVVPIVPTLPRISPPVITDIVPLIDIGTPPLVDDRKPFGGPAVRTGMSGAPTLASSFNPNGVFEDAAVDRSPSILGAAPAPRYPSALREHGVSGHVVVRFVVDTLGRAETDGVQILESTHDQFADAVRAALGRFRFNAGEVGGRKVRTMVQLPFTFTLTR